MGQCQHGLEESWCDLCVAPPPGVQAMVWVTKGGNHFHNDPNCQALDDGQYESAQRGDRVHARQHVLWSSVRHERSRCRTCVPRY